MGSWFIGSLLIAVLGAVLGLITVLLWEHVRARMILWVCWLANPIVQEHIGKLRFRRHRAYVARKVLGQNALELLLGTVWFKGEFPLFRSVVRDEFENNPIMWRASRRVLRIRAKRDFRRRRRIHKRVRCILCGTRRSTGCQIGPVGNVAFSGSCGLTPTGAHYCNRCRVVYSHVFHKTLAREPSMFDIQAFRATQEESCQGPIRQLRVCRDSYDRSFTALGRRKAMRIAYDLRNELYELVANMPDRH